MKKKSSYNVCVVGVGAVGIEMIRILRQRNFPINELRVLARSFRDITLDGMIYAVKEISPEQFDGVDIALFAGTEGEKGAAVTYAKEAVKRGAVVIDNGSDFRMDPGVPLVVPEINPQDIKKHKGIIANPNCSTIQMVVALWPIHRAVTVKRVVVSTYQAASGAGRQAVEELLSQTKCAVGNDVSFKCIALPQRIAFNLFPHISKFEDYDYTNEEWKMVKETHKIMHDKNIKVTATCARVPVANGHSEAVYIETKDKITAKKARALLSKAPGVKLVDELVPSDSDKNRRSYPMPIDADGKDEVFVGRVREDPFVKNGLWLWVVSDNLRKGAALNAVQIAELVIK